MIPQVARSNRVTPANATAEKDFNMKQVWILKGEYIDKLTGQKVRLMSKKLGERWEFAKELKFLCEKYGFSNFCLEHLGSDPIQYGYIDEDMLAVMFFVKGHPRWLEFPRLLSS